MTYTPEQLQRAKKDGLPLFKIEVDYRFVPKDFRPVKKRQIWGATTAETARELSEIMRNEA